MKKNVKKGRNVEAEFFFCPDDIHRCVMGNKKPFVLDWPPVPITWPVKFGTNLTRKEVLKLEDAGFQLQQQEALSPWKKFQTQVNIPIPRSRFHVPILTTRMLIPASGSEKNVVGVQMPLAPTTRTNG